MSTEPKYSKSKAVGKILHRMRQKPNKTCKAVTILEGDMVVGEYPSVNDAAKALGCRREVISKYHRSKKLIMGKYTMRYKK